MATKKTAKHRAAEADDDDVHVFPNRPTKEEAFAQVQRFFHLLTTEDVETAGAAIAHQGKDFWPHQIRSLWQDLVVPYLEEEGEGADLDDDDAWRKLDWLSEISIEKNAQWQDDDDFYVNLEYAGEATDVSAEFSIVKRGEGWVVQRNIIHIA